MVLRGHGQIANHVRPISLCGRLHVKYGVRTRAVTWPPVRRTYANPARFNVPSKIAFKPPPPPAQPVPSIEDGHAPGEVEKAAGPFDEYLEQVAESIDIHTSTPVTTLFKQYRERAERVLELIVSYEERPAKHRRAYTNNADPSSVGDGLVMIVHASRKANGKLNTICACSGFVVKAQSIRGDTSKGEVLITCAHTLEEMYRKLPKLGEGKESPTSFSFAITSDGSIYAVNEVLSSMPKSDIIALQATATSSEGSRRLRTLPVTPFPVHNGETVLTHLFDASSPPAIKLSTSRLPPAAKDWSEKDDTEKSTRWLGNKAWRRWGVGTMLGYRSYTGIEVEAGIHSSLPHILTSVLPTPGSSGGPLVSAETGAVVGMISGRRMDNRVEGERGWGTSSEGIFEMFSLPGFTPAS